MALTKDERLPPEPRLQAAPGFAVTLENGQRIDLQKSVPQAEYRALRDEWMKALNGELKDPSGNSVSMPIDQAMKQVVSENALPIHSAIVPLPLREYAVSLPTAMSSGRETEKRLQ
jgi:hypothetical protein